MRLHVTALATLVTLSLVRPAQAQSGAQTITEADIRRRVFIIAHDSMGGRDTPSRGLDLTAGYVAAEFTRMKLEPGGDRGTFFQRYTIRTREIDPSGSWIAFADESGTERIKLSADAASPMFGAPRETHVAVPFVLIGGPISPSSRIDLAAIRGKALVWIAPDTQGPSFSAVMSLAAAAKAPFMVAIVRADSTYGKLPAQQGEVVTADSVGRPPLFRARESAILAQFPEASAQIEAARNATDGAVIEVPGWTVIAHTVFRRDEPTSVPNVIGMIEGSDPTLKSQSVIVTAHMDHVGSRCRGADGPDKICNGADDNASGTTGLLELAEAFASKGARPKRSMIFAAVSGEERGLWGSQYVAEHPPVPIGQIVANVNMDHLGRNWRDSIAVIGAEHSDLGLTVERVAKNHPELRMTPLPDQWPNENIYFRSDHYNFARLGVPILFFTNGFHPDYHAVTDSPDKIDAEKQSRVVRFIYQVLAEIANAPTRPEWKRESYDQIVIKR